MCRSVRSLIQIFDGPNLYYDRHLELGRILFLFHLFMYSVHPSLS